MKLAAAFLLGSVALVGQVVPPTPAPQVSQDLPKYILTVGGGFASPNGKFAYVSESSLVLPQGTYLTVSQEYSIVKGQVQSCTFAGAAKPLYRFSVITAGVTGLGGGCNSTVGDSSAAASGQGFLHINWGRLPFGNVITVQKNSNTGYKVTFGFTWSKQQP